MKRFTLGLVAAGMVATGLGLWFYRHSLASNAPDYRFATATRGDIQATVAATGALGAVTSIQVGTQVSGQVSAIYVDFNDRVKKGQLLARIDPTLLEQSVQDAQATLERVQAQFAQADSDFARNQQLRLSKVITATEYDTSLEGYAVAKANVKSAQIALSKARQSLAYTLIHAPIDGVIVERDVDVGQTVAASLSAPQLFIIANDLSHMEILAEVDESDIGRIAPGQAVQFTVQTYPGQTFTGTVKQVRLQSKTDNNVVNYTVVVSVEDANGKLLPGMTATVQFVTATATNAVLVPNAALRLQATPAMVALVGAAADVRVASAKTGMRTKADSGVVAPVARGRIWYMGPDDKLAMATVEIGLTDGQNTVVRSPAITAGTRVIVGVSGGATSPAASTATKNPLQPQSAGRRGGGGF